MLNPPARFPNVRTLEHALDEVVVGRVPLSKHPRAHVLAG